jgi:hypothetical protein
MEHIIPKIFFFCCEQGTPEAARHQYGIIPLAEGLTEQGIICYSNVNYYRLNWADSSKYLFIRDLTVNPKDCDIVVLNDRWFLEGNPIPDGLFRKGRKYITVYIDCSDGVFTHTFKHEWRAFDFIFKAHYNQRIKPMPANVRPWAFGLPKRIIAATKGAEDWENRSDALLSNFRVEHDLRKTAKEILYPLLKDLFTIDYSNDGFAPPVEPVAVFEWEQNGRRHNPAYYEKLKKSKAVSCFGGRYAHRFAQPALLQKPMRRIEHILPHVFMALYQWDSFRLWETFSAGCLVFHVDFEKEGCVLPVMPQNGIHYMGMDLADPGKIRKQVMDLHSVFSQIAHNGKEWAQANYSPFAIARRFLSELGYNPEKEHEFER